MDDAIHIPGTRIRFGIDPMVGLIPVLGDVLTVFCGAFILLTARQLKIPQKELARMMYYQALNGLVGAIPVVGDLYSFSFKSHAKNSAVLVSALKHTEHRTCQITAPSLSLLDVGVVLAMTAPLAGLVGFVGWWCWKRNLSLITFFF